MVGLVVATHGHMADEMVATAEQIVGKLPAVATCSIEPGAAVADIRSKVKSAIAAVNAGDGVIVMADLFGGTPCKESLMVCRPGEVEVLTGVNLPMLIKASSLRNEKMTLEDLAHALTQYAQKNITCASDLIRAHADSQGPVR